jgi:hypothetical protein
MSTSTLPRRTSRARRLALALAVGGAAVLVGYLLTVLTSTPAPFAVAVLAAVIGCWLSLFEGPASPSRWTSRVAWVLVWLGVGAFTAGWVAFAVPPGGGEPWGSFSLVWVGVLLIVAGMAGLLVSGAIHIVTLLERRHPGSPGR